MDLKRNIHVVLIKPYTSLMHSSYSNKRADSDEPRSALRSQMQQNNNKTVHLKQLFQTK